MPLPASSSSAGTSLARASGSASGSASGTGLTTRRLDVGSSDSSDSSDTDGTEDGGFDLAGAIEKLMDDDQDELLDCSEELKGADDAELDDDVVRKHNKDKADALGRHHKVGPGEFGIGGGHEGDSSGVDGVVIDDAELELDATLERELKLATGDDAGGGGAVVCDFEGIFASLMPQCRASIELLRNRHQACLSNDLSAPMSTKDWALRQMSLIEHVDSISRAMVTVFVH